MIFAMADHIKQIIASTKTQTRRSSNRYKVRHLYAIQPGRGKKGIPDGKLYIAWKKREWKPDLSDLPEDARFVRRWRVMKAGYPLQDYEAKAEGGYTPEEYEELYEKTHPGWTERWAYDFTFFSKEELDEIGSCEKTPTKDE